MTIRSASALLWLLLFVVLGGCADPLPAPAPSTQTASPAPSGLPPQAPPSQVAAAEAYQTQAQAAQAAAQPPESAAVDGAVEQVRAGVGVGKQGRRLDQFDSGVQQAIAQPAKSLFAAKERLIFDQAIPYAMKLFEATNGRPPRSHDEFMKQIVAANQLELPPLPDGHRYVYDPQTKELMVERPAQQ